MCNYIIIDDLEERKPKRLPRKLKKKRKKAMRDVFNFYETDYPTSQYDWQKLNDNYLM